MGCCIPRLKPWVVVAARCVPGLARCLVWMSGMVCSILRDGGVSQGLGCGIGLVSLGPSVVLGVDVRDWYTMSCAWVLRPKAKALGCEHGLGRLGAAWCLVWMSGLVYPPRWGCVPRLKPWVVMTARCLLGLVWCLLWMSGGGILCPA